MSSKGEIAYTQCIFLHEVLHGNKFFLKFGVNSISLYAEANDHLWVDFGN
jgi:hypothetical protein